MAKFDPEKIFELPTGNRPLFSIERTFRKLV
jgi:hypothetical protein